jgi:SAM-dependent methyltransferase
VDACKLAKEWYGIEIFDSEFPPIDKYINYFDVIIIHHVIEHVTNPLEFLEIANRYLVIGGCMFIETPNINNIGIRLTGKDKIIAGECIVKLPEYTNALCKEDGINIQLTNIKHGKVLWIEEIDLNNNQFIVFGENADNREFFWTFTAIRKDIADIVVEKDSKEI